MFRLTPNRWCNRRIALRWLLCLCVIVLSIGQFGSQPVEGQGSNLYVSGSGSDISNNCQNISSPCKTLQYALSQAASGDTIDVYGIVFANAIKGQGATIPTSIASLQIVGTNGNSTVEDLQPTSLTTINPSGGSVITIPQAGQQISITDLTLSDGDNQYGGGIYAQSGTTTMLNGVKVYTNFSTNGGGIYNAGTMSIIDSSIVNNFAGNIGVFCLVSSPNQCVQLAYGGGIYNGGRLTISRSLISQNVIDESLSSYSSSPANYYGGGIFNGGRLDMFESSVTHNSISGSAGNGQTISGTITDGGGIFNISQNSAVIASTIAGNHVSVNGGGAGIGFGPGVLAPSLLKMSGSYVVDNTDRNTTDLINNCSLGQATGTIFSLGYNVSDSSECNFTASGDVSNVKVTPVDAHSRYFVPTSGSIGLEMVPYDTVISYSASEPNFTLCPTTDELGNSRPSSASGYCDVGAIEINYGQSVVSPSITSAATTTFIDGEQGSFTFTSTGTPKITYNTTTTLPSGITLSPEGVLSGVSSGGGPYSFRVTAKNYGGHSSQNFTINFQKATSSITLKASPSPSEAGVSTKVSVAVEDANGTNKYPPTGSVEISTPGVNQPLCDIQLSDLSILNIPSAISVGSCNIESPVLRSMDLIASYPGDGNYLQAKATTSLTINGAITISSKPANSSILVGSNYSYTPTISGGVGADIFSESGHLPPGLNFDSSVGSLSGRATAAGTYSYWVSVKDSLGASATQNESITVDRSNSSLLLSISPTVALAGSSVVLSATINGFNPTGYVNFFDENGPLCSSLISGNAASCRITLDSGNYSLYASYSGDGNNYGQVSGSASLNLLPTLALSASNPHDATVGNYYNTSLNAQGGTPPYEWTLVSGNLPNGLSLSTSGVLYGTPTAQGSFTFRVLDSDSGLLLHQQSIATYTLIVVAHPATSSGSTSPSGTSNPQPSTQGSPTTPSGTSNPQPSTQGSPTTPSGTSNPQPSTQGSPTTPSDFNLTLTNPGSQASNIQGSQLIESPSSSSGFTSPTKPTLMEPIPPSNTINVTNSNAPSGSSSRSHSGTTRPDRFFITFTELLFLVFALMVLIGWIIYRSQPKSRPS
ncbi:putative Ig domain-containing protein [Acidithrix ferrooxidans]|uniref:Putative Ig domain protein n=2 Tax=root TaxID=1 RepID=A0A0D8HLR8_9ACTN|nr:putative Ig domain-containing protein [Acidithrix ferrooxidans]KJF18804.1 putative Ig domain protein [Acidithrix ferrooxidans]